MLALEVRVRHAPSSSAGIWQAVQGALRRQLGLQTFHRGCCRSTGVGEKLRPAAGLEGFPALSPGLGTPVLEPHLEGRREEKKTVLGYTDLISMYTFFCSLLHKY